MNEEHDEFTIRDLGREVTNLTKMVSSLKAELEEMNDRHARRWTTTIIANVSLALVVITLLVGYASIRDVTVRLDEESVMRAEQNCDAIRDSRDIIRDILVIMTSRNGTEFADIPEAQRKGFEEMAQRSQERTTEALSLLSDVDC